MQSLRAAAQFNSSPYARPSRLILSLAFLAVPLRAQTTTPPDAPAPPDDHPYTLHVYTRLIQLPTLVLSRNRTELPPIDPQRFTISLDSGPRFHATHIRREGDDPITLALLLDVSGDQSELLPALDREFPAWLSASLNPQDHLSIYALDCALFQTTEYTPSTDPALLHDLDIAIQSPQTHGNKKQPACHSSLNMRDAIVTVMRRMSALPGRRVLLVITDGYDGGSSVNPSALRIEATDSAVTLFGLTAPTLVSPQQEYIFNYLVESSGGIVTETSAKKVAFSLSDFVAKLRGRYILEFPTPANPTPGGHEIHVTIDHSNAFIATSGTTVGLPDPALEHNPTTIQNEHSDSPIIGNHKPNP